MLIEMDDDVKSTAEFMQRTLRADKLVSVAHALSHLAPILWGKYDAVQIEALSLRGETISGCDQPTQLDATE